MLHVHKEHCDEIEMVKVVNEFINKNAERKKLFGQLTETDVLQASSQQYPSLLGHRLSDFMPLELDDCIILC